MCRLKSTVKAASAFMIAKIMTTKISHSYEFILTLLKTARFDGSVLKEALMDQPQHEF